MSIKLVSIVLVIFFIVSCGSSSSGGGGSDPVAILKITNNRTETITKLAFSKSSSVGAGNCLGTDVLGGNLSPGASRTTTTATCGSSYYMCYTMDSGYYFSTTSEGEIKCDKTYTLPLNP